VSEQNNNSLDDLSFLIGTWRTEGKVLPDGNIPGTSINGTDSYEWVLDHHFILHKVDVVIGTTRVEALEFISPDPEKGVYRLRSFENRGEFAEMKAWLVQGTFHISANNMQAHLAVKDSGHLDVRWERSEDGLVWKPWMELRLTK
jgi:hypothetical protein